MKKVLAARPPDRDVADVPHFPLLALVGQADAIRRIRTDHGGLHVFVAKQFLHGANGVSVLPQVSGEARPKGMAADALVDMSGADGVDRFGQFDVEDFTVEKEQGGERLVLGGGGGAALDRKVG